MSSVNGSNGMSEFVKFGSSGAFGDNRAGGLSKIGGSGEAGKFGFVATLLRPRSGITTACYNKTVPRHQSLQ